MAELTDEVLIEHYRKDGSKQAINLLCQRYWNEVNHLLNGNTMLHLRTAKI